jgi:SAM-dependent methyltransferase
MSEPVIEKVVRALKSFRRAPSKTRWLARKARARTTRRKTAQAGAAFVERLPHEQAANKAFDLRFHTDTADEVALVEAGMSAEQAAMGNGVYRPLWESDFHATMAALGIAFDGFTFVDIGSGKGKLLLLASDYPFSRIVGIEYSPRLHAAAHRNIEVYCSPTQRCGTIEAFQGDALDFRLPDGALVCLLFNALNPTTTRKFVERQEASLAFREAPAFFIHANLRHIAEIDDGFDGLRHLQCLKQTDKLIVFGNAAARALHRSSTD